MAAHPFPYTAKRHISCSWQRLNSLGAMSAVSFVSSNLGLLAPEVPERIGRTAGQFGAMHCSTASPRLGCSQMARKEDPILGTGWLFRQYVCGETAMEQADLEGLSPRSALLLGE